MNFACTVRSFIQLNFVKCRAFIWLIHLYNTILFLQEILLFSKDA